MSALAAVSRWLGLASLLALAVIVWLPRDHRRTFTAVWASSFAATTVSALARWAATGHPPIFGTHENTLAASWAILLLVGVRVVRQRRAFNLSLRLLVSWIPVTLAYGQAFSAELLPLTISERSLWVDIHVFFAWLAYALLLEATMQAVQGLLDGGGVAIDHRVGRGAGFGFAVLTAMLAVGSWYSYQLFGDWYRWEIVETLAAATWLGYACVVHAKLILGWRGRKLYASMAAVLPLLILTFWVWSLYSGTYHFFDIGIVRAG